MPINQVNKIRGNIKIIFSDINEKENIYHIFAKEILYLWKLTGNNNNIIIVLIHFNNKSNIDKWRLSLLKLLYKYVYYLPDTFALYFNNKFITDMNIKHSYEEVKNFYDKDNVIKMNKLRQSFLNNNNNKNILINYYNKHFKSNNIKVKTKDVITYNTTIANLNNIMFINFNTMAITDYILCKINHKEISLSNEIKKQLNLKINYDKLKVGFIYRNNNRILFDYESKHKYNKNILVHTILHKECKKINIPFEAISFDNATFEEQAEFLKDVKILIACHGATLTNLFLLPKNATIFEISFRKNLYCDPICEKHLKGIIPYTQDCFNRSKELNGYFYDEANNKLKYSLAHYYNLSQLFGIGYQEILIEDANTYYYIDNNVYPINLTNLYINTDTLLQDIKKIY